MVRDNGARVLQPNCKYCSQSRVNNALVRSLQEKTIYNQIVPITVQLSFSYVQKHMNYHLAQSSSQNH